MNNGGKIHITSRIRRALMNGDGRVVFGNVIGGCYGHVVLVDREM